MTDSFVKNSFCSYCGHAFEADQGWPRRCARCGNTSFQNPIPVVVLLQPVDAGVLVVRRGIEPQRGELALPGGYIDYGESWQAAAAREVHEEAGVHINPDDVDVIRVFSAPDGTLVVVGQAPPLRNADLPPYRPTLEASERLVITQPQPLAWDLHTEVVTDYFRRRAAAAGAG